jgi:hypothetical protein
VARPSWASGSKSPDCLLHGLQIVDQDAELAAGFVDLTCDGAVLLDQACNRVSPIDVLSGPRHSLGAGLMRTWEECLEKARELVSLAGEYEGSAKEVLLSMAETWLEIGRRSGNSALVDGLKEEHRIRLH